MKFQSQQAFEKHLGQSPPNCLATLYGVFIADSFERGYFVEKIAKAIYGKKIHIVQGVFGSWSIDKIMSELDTSDFFATEKVVAIDEIQKCKKLDFEKLIAFLQKAPLKTPLVLTGGFIPSDFSLYEPLKKDMVLLDLSQEKSWEKEDRLKAFTVQYAASLQKKIDREALEFLFDQVGASMVELRQRIDQCSCFVGEKAFISAQDLQDIIPKSKEITIWPISEAAVWGGKESGKIPNEQLDSAVLLSALRYHLEIGLQISEHMDDDKSEQSVRSFFPQIRPKQFEKYWDLTKPLPSGYFKKALNDLFELELSLRQYSHSIDNLLQVFLGKLTYYRMVCHES